MERAELIDRLLDGEKRIDFGHGIRVERTGAEAFLVRFDGDHKAVRKACGFWPGAPGILVFSAVDRALDLRAAIEAGRLAP